MDRAGANGDGSRPGPAGYWAPVVLPISRTVPPAPSTSSSALPRGAVVVAVLAGVLALVAAVGGQRVQAASGTGLRPVDSDASTSAGWGPTHVDDQGRPARWDPCAPIHYVVQAGWMPDSGRADLDEALDRLSTASGLNFVADGDSGEIPSLDRSAYQPDRYGDRWAPLLIGWVPATATDLPIGSGTQGLSLSVVVPGRGGPSLVSGQVVLDAASRLSGGFGAGTTDGEVLLHELAHAVGLGHVLDPTQVMYPQTTNSQSQYGAGDRAGLAAVGAPAGCHPAPQAQEVRLQRG